MWPGLQLSPSSGGKGPFQGAGHRPGLELNLTPVDKGFFTAGVLDNKHKRSEVTPPSVLPDASLELRCSEAKTGKAQEAGCGFWPGAWAPQLCGTWLQGLGQGSCPGRILLCDPPL